MISQDLAIVLIVASISGGIALYFLYRLSDSVPKSLVKELILVLKSVSSVTVTQVDDVVLSEVYELMDAEQLTFKQALKRIIEEVILTMASESKQ